MEKGVILADKGMPTDRHMHSAHTLIGVYSEAVQIYIIQLTSLSAIYRENRPHKLRVVDYSFPHTRPSFNWLISAKLFSRV